MALINFPIIAGEDADPMGAGLEAGNRFSKQLQDLYAGSVKNRYLPDVLKQNLIASQLNNRINQVKANYAEPTAQQELMKQQLANQWFSPEKQSEVNYRNALTSAVPSEIGQREAETKKTNYLTDNPAFMATTPLSQLLALQNALKNNPGLLSGGGNNQPSSQAPAAGSNVQLPNGSVAPVLPGPRANITDAQVSASPPTTGANNIYNSLLNQITGSGARAAEANQRVTGAPYLFAPPDSRRTMVGQAAAFGISPDDATDAFVNKGKRLADLAEEKGFGRDPSKWPEPSYNPTIATLSRNQQRQAAVAELNAVEPFINSSLGQYSQTIHGFSPKQVLDSFESLHGNTPNVNQKKEKLSDFLAASIVVPEYNAIRGRAMGLQNMGVEALRSIGGASMNDFKKFQSLVPPDVYMQAQTKANNLIKKMSSAANKAVKVKYGQESTPQENQFQSQNSESPITKILHGKTYTKINGVWHE